MPTGARRTKKRRRRSASAKQTYILNYTIGNVSKRTTQTREEVRQWLKTHVKKEKACPYCSTGIGLGNFAVDHKQAIARGGSPLLANCQLTCGPCNRAKGDLNDVEFRDLVAFLTSQSTDMKKSVLARLKAAGAMFKR